MKICNIEGCPKTVRAKGWCSTHYERQRVHGDALHTAWDKTTAERFWAKVNKTDDCWNWVGASTKGHGVMYVKELEGMYRAHRYSYELVHGQVDKDLVIDHRCHNGSCIKPDHLRPATPKQNGENRKGLDANNSSGYRGVSLSKHTGKWYVRVYHKKKCYYGGQFLDVHEAGEAARVLRNKLFSHNDLDRMLD